MAVAAGAAYGRDKSVSEFRGSRGRVGSAQVEGRTAMRVAAAVWVAAQSVAETVTVTIVFSARSARFKDRKGDLAQEQPSP